MRISRHLAYSFFVIHLTLTGNIMSQIKPHVDPVIDQGIDSNKHYRNEVFGYRIQLAFDSDKEIIDSLRLKFSSSYPKTEVYVAFEAPYFNFMVGDYRSEIEAALFKQQLIGSYPLAVIQRTKIKLPRID